MNDYFKRMIRDLIAFYCVIFVLQNLGYNELSIFNYVGISVGIIFLLDIPVKIYKNYMKPTETIRPRRWDDPSSTDTEVESDDSDVTVVGEE